MVKASPQPSARPSGKPKPIDKAADPIPAAQFDSISDELSVLTYNVWGLPGLLGTDRKARFERLGATLNAYDVVTLQETFSDDIELIKASAGFPYPYRHDNSTLLKGGSGLYTLSKYPILTTGYQAFGHCSGLDCLVRKGVLMAGLGFALSMYSFLASRGPNAIGLVLLFVGLGFVVLWWFEQRHLAPPAGVARDAAPGPGPTPGNPPPT